MDKQERHRQRKLRQKAKKQGNYPLSKVEGSQPAKGKKDTKATKAKRGYKILVAENNKLNPDYLKDRQEMIDLFGAKRKTPPVYFLKLLNGLKHVDKVERIKYYVHLYLNGNYDVQGIKTIVKVENSTKPQRISSSIRVVKKR